VTRRLVGVAAWRPASGPFPSAALRRAMVEDVYEAVAALELVEPVLVVGDDPSAEALEELTWPGTAVVRITAQGPAVEALTGMHALGAEEATVVAGDAPDLPALLIGKLHRGLGSADVAVLPARGGGLVALACRCPVPPWLVASGADLDTPDALERLRAAAPRRTALSVGPGWHRLRDPDDESALDEGLEGWELTRAALRDASR
jgi:glycosyltransferase A (GT-A) superfamily protein (DUF2064 family)